MSKKRFPHRQSSPDVEPPHALERIFWDLESPDPATRASAVRQLCPCRGVTYGVPIFPRVIEMRNDPSPIVRDAVDHDLNENPDWGERREARRLEGRRRRRETERVEEEIHAGAPADEQPAPHSLAWYTPRRPRSRKQYYPPRRRRMPVAPP
jgi:hypothetical protein